MVSGERSTTLKGVLVLLLRGVVFAQLQCNTSATAAPDGRRTSSGKPVSVCAAALCERPALASAAQNMFGCSQQAEGAICTNMRLSTTTSWCDTARLFCSAGVLVQCSVDVKFRSMAAAAPVPDAAPLVCVAVHAQRLGALKQVRQVKVVDVVACGSRNISGRRRSS